VMDKADTGKMKGVDGKRPTINDVASLAGVSKKTVSRVINSVPKVSPATAEKVNVAIEQLGFVPNFQARGLAARYSYLLGFVYDNPNAYYVLEMLNSFLRQCRENGFELIVHPCDYRSPGFTTDIVRFARQSQVDGLVLLPPISEFDELLSALAAEHLPFVRIGSREDAHHAPMVRCDDEDAAARMTTHLLDLGHDKIAFIAGHPDHASSHARLRGYENVLQNEGIPLRPEYIRWSKYTFESGEEQGGALLDLADPPTAIFASNDAVACGVMHIAHERGIAVPAELSVAGYDDSPIALQIWPSLTTLRQPVGHIGKIAANELIKSIRGEHGERFETIVLHPELKLRESTAPPTYRDPGKDTV
jgi:LacI family transcriptional regulator